MNILNNIEKFFKENGLIMTVLGAIFLFLKELYFKNKEQKHENRKEESKEMLKQKRIILTKAIDMINKYEIEQKTLHGFYEDEHGKPIKEINHIDIYTKYFLKIFEYLHENRLYLEKDTIKKLDAIIKFYTEYTFNKKVINSELDNQDIDKKIVKEKEKLFKDTEVKFNTLLEAIKYNEIRDFKEKMGV